MMRVAIGWMLVASLLLSLDAAAQEGVDVRLLIDVSGSMKSGDPEYLRQDVLNGLGEILPPGSRAGVWTFGRSADQVVPHGVVDDAWRRTARAARSTIGSSAKRTNLSDALAKAAWDVAQAEPEWNRHIVLVTDGRVDVADDAASNEAQRRAIRDELLPRLRAANIRLDCLALSAKADMNFLEQIAGATGGYAARADSVAAVKAYLATALNGLLHDGSFIVAKETGEITVFADRTGAALVLTSPAGIRIDASTKAEGVRWFDGDGYSMMTIASPAVGAWHIAPPPERVQVWKELGIAIQPDDSTEAPAIRVALTEAGTAIDEPRLASAIAVEAELKTLYGTEPLPATAVEALPLTYSVGLGEMRLTADDEVTVRVAGKTFERSRIYTERIAHPIDVDFRDAPDGNAGAMVHVNVPEMDAGSLRVLGSTRTGAGRVKLVVGTKQSDGAWLVAIPRLEPHVEVRFKVLFNFKNNNKIEAESDPISLVLPLMKSKHVGLDLEGHIIVDPVRPAPVVAAQPVSEPPAEIAPALTEPVVVEAPSPSTEAVVPVAPEARTPAIWEWIAMAGVAIASMALLAWWMLRSRTSAPAVALDATLARYRETLKSTSPKPAGAATT